MNDELFKYIKPKEFTFCSRCGKNIRYGSQDFICGSCKHSLFHSEKTPTDEELLECEYERNISVLIREHRETLAKLRLEHSKIGV